MEKRNRQRLPAEGNPAVNRSGRDPPADAATNVGGTTFRVVRYLPGWSRPLHQIVANMKQSGSILAQRGRCRNQTQTILQEVAEEAEKIHESGSPLRPLLPPVKIQSSEIVANVNDPDRY